MVKPIVQRPKRDKASLLKIAYVECLIENTDELPVLKKKKRKTLLSANDRELLIKREAIKKDTQIQVCRSTKQALYETEIIRKTTALECKFRRFEIRCQLERVQAINMGWISVFAAIGSVTVFIKKGANYKKLRARADKNLKFLLYMSRFFGILLLTRRRRQINSQMTTLRRLMKPIRMWLSVRRTVLSNYMVNCIEYSLTNNLMFKLMVRWRINTIYIQSQIRAFLAFRRRLYATQLKRLREVEMTSVKGTKKKSGDGHSLIPDEVKLYFVRRKVKEELYNHMLALKFYKLNCAKVNDHNSQQKTDRSVRSEDGGFSLLPLPQRPKLDLNFPKEVYRHILVAASSSRYHWDKIISHGDAQIDLQMRSRRR